MDAFTILVGIVVLFLLYQLSIIAYRKLFLEFGDDIPTILVNPLQQTPEQIRKMHMTPLGGMKALGPVFRTVNRYKPWIRNITIGDPNLMREIWVSKDWEKFDRQHPMSEPHFPYTAGFIHAKNGAVWRDTKSMFDRTFSTVSVRKYTPILTEQRDVMMDQLAKTNSANPQGFDIYPLMVKLTFDVTRLSFGAGVKAQTTKEGADYANRFERWMQCAAKMSSFLQLFGKWSYIFIQPVVKQWKEDGDALFGLVRAERARVERGESRISILDDAMAIVQSEKVPATMTDRQLELVFMSLLFGGHDTTSALLSFTLYELAKRPDLQTEIRREVEDVCGSSPIDNLEALEKCKVLNACIKESLRKTPSAPFGATRNIFEGFDFQYTSFDGKPKKIKFCKGDRLITYIWGIQNYPGYWNTDPSKWSPERFYEDPTGGTTAGLYAYSPFGQGPRRCLGERLGLGEARLCLASILRRWQVDLVPETDWKYEETYHGTISPNKVMVKLVAVSGKK